MAKVKTAHGKYKGVLVGITDMRKLKAKLEVKSKEITDFIVFRFEQIGEKAVKIARELKPDDGSFHDVTGNLRSSIGYMILVDGRVVKQGAPKQYPGRIGDGGKGVSEGISLLSKLKAKFPYGIVLVLCAGMEYAAFVENVKHKDVLTSASLNAEQLVKKLIGKLLEATE